MIYPNQESAADGLPWTIVYMLDGSELRTATRDDNLRKIVRANRAAPWELYERDTVDSEWFHQVGTVGKSLAAKIAKSLKLEVP